MDKGIEAIVVTSRAPSPDVLAARTAPVATCLMPSTNEDELTPLDVFRPPPNPSVRLR